MVSVRVGSGLGLLIVRVSGRVRIMVSCWVVWVL